MHLTDVQLNEYLDNEIEDRTQIELHLSSCDECVARLTALKAFFNEIESLPELGLSRSLAAPFVSTGLNASTRDQNLSSPLPRSLCLTVTLQAATAMIVLIITAPLVMQLILPYLSGVQMPSFVELFLSLQSQWISWLNHLSTFHFPIMPRIPVFELSSLMIVITLVVVSTLWLVGNGLLLRNPIKNKTSR